MPSPDKSRPRPGNPSAASRRMMALIKKIPKGKVASYGQLAALAGNPRGARQVVRILHSFSELKKLPWHRVVDRNGRISLPMDGSGDLQRRLLRAEGVTVSADGAISLARHGWRP